MVTGDGTEHSCAMTTTPPEAPSGPAADGEPAGAPHGPADGHPPGGPRVSRDEIRDLGRLRRSAYDRKVAGVAGGLARHLDIDPMILRVAFVVLSFFGGAGLIIYGACWLLVPDEGLQDATIRLDERSRSVALVLVGVIAALALVGDSVGGWGFPWPLVIIGVVVLLVMAARGDRAPRPDPSYAAPADGQAPAAAAPAAGPAAAPYGYYTPPAPRPRNPRRRGPLLFWFTLALITLAVGVLGIVDLAGADVADSGYPALVLAITGVMLLVGAFYGRAGGLIALGLLAAMVTAGTTVAGEVDAGRLQATPGTTASIQDRYEVTAGEIELDLRQVSDPENLDGLTIDLESTFGRVEVIVPDGVDVAVNARVDAGGHTSIFGIENDGSNTHVHDGGEGAPVLTIDAEVTFGEIQVDTTGGMYR